MLPGARERPPAVAPDAGNGGSRRNPTQGGAPGRDDVGALPGGPAGAGGLVNRKLRPTRRQVCRVPTLRASCGARQPQIAFPRPSERHQAAPAAIRVPLLHRFCDMQPAVGRKPPVFIGRFWR